LLCARCIESSSALPRSAWLSGLHPCLQTAAPVARSSEALRFRDSSSSHTLSRLVLQPRLPTLPTMTSADFSLRPVRSRRPFRHKARAPQVRTPPFSTRPPDLRRRPLTTRASRSLARSPWSAPPRIRLLYAGPWMRSTRPSHSRSPFCSCASLRLSWSTFAGTCTPKVAPMLGAPKQQRGYDQASYPLLRFRLPIRSYRLRRHDTRG